MEKALRGIKQIIPDTRELREEREEGEMRMDSEYVRRKPSSYFTWRSSRRSAETADGKSSVHRESDSNALSDGSLKFNRARNHNGSLARAGSCPHGLPQSWAWATLRRWALVSLSLSLERAVKYMRNSVNFNLFFNLPNNFVILISYKYYLKVK